jgi:hypothetical protein
MELLNEIRKYYNTGVFPKQAVNEAYFLFEAFSNEELSEDNETERDDVLNKIKMDKFVVNDYPSFFENLYSGKRKSFLSQYTPEEFKENGVKTYQVEGYPIGFALKPDKDGVDIISVHNNSEVRNIGDELISAAVRLGGTKLDHFDGFLSDLYQKHGFDEYERYKWDDAYAPEEWNYEKYGRPDVVYRRLNKNPQG